MSGYAQLLRNNPGFARLWLAQVISLTGDWFNVIVLSALVVEYTGGSGLAVSALLLARVLPPLLISPAAGVLADRFSRKRLLILSDVLRAAVVLLFLLATGPETLWLIYVLTIVQFSLSAVFWPAQSAITPSLVPHEDLVLANTLGSVTWSAMLAIGAILGGVVAGLLGPVVALMFDSATFLLSALLISRITPRYAQPPTGATPAPKPAAANRGFVDGLRYAVRRPATAAVLLVKAGLSLINVDALLVIYATEVFVLGEGGTGSMGVLYAAFGVGAVLGPVLLNRFNDGSVQVMRRLIVAGFAMIALSWFMLTGAPSLLAAALVFTLRAMGGSANWTYSSVIIQKQVEDAFLGRMFALDGAANQFASTIGTIVTGALIQAAGRGNLHVVTLAGALTSLIPLILWTAALPWMGRKERAAQGEAAVASMR